MGLVHIINVFIIWKDCLIQSLSLHIVCLRDDKIIYFLVIISIEDIFWSSILTDRSSNQRCSVRKGVLRNFRKFTGKDLWQRNLQALACNFIKKQTLAQVFSCEFCGISKDILTEHLRTAAF